MRLEQGGGAVQHLGAAGGGHLRPVRRAGLRGGQRRLEVGAGGVLHVADGVVETCRVADGSRRAAAGAAAGEHRAGVPVALARVGKGRLQPCQCCLVVQIQPGGVPSRRGKEIDRQRDPRMRRAAQFGRLLHRVAQQLVDGDRRIEDLVDEG